MLATAPVHQRLLRSQLSFVSLLRLLMDPLIAIGTLAMVATAQGEAFRGKYLVLALIVFSLTFPGTLDLTIRPRAIFREIFLGWFPIVILLVLFGYATEYLTAFPWRVMLTWFVAAPAALFLAHVAARLYLPKVLSLESNQRTAVIAGANELGIKLANRFQNETVLGIRLIGFFDDRSRSRLTHAGNYPLHGPLANIAAFVKQHRVDLIYVALPMASQPRILKLLDELRDTTASIYFIPDIFLADLIQARLDDVSGIPVVAVCETPFYGVNGLIKRIEDVIFSSLILLLISPVVLFAAIGVKLGSPGPVLFKQRRYGLDGKEIIVYKFRSMTVCEDGDHIPQATRSDRRITPFGTFLRKTSLDELPQFINVLQGRMSIVGPRPHAVAHNEIYRKLIKGYMIRHKVKPGITGWAQVNGFRGETDTLEKMRARIEYDLDYLRNWSVRLDLHVIMRTAMLVFRDARAY